MRVKNGVRQAVTVEALLRAMAREALTSAPIQRFWLADDEEAGELLEEAMLELSDVERIWAARLVQRLSVAADRNPSAIFPWLG